MKLKAKILTVVAGILSVNGYALTPEAASGKEHFAVCHACHNPALNPSLAPPMWGVQRRYKRMSRSKERFVDSIADFAKQPAQERALFKHAIPVMGLMPPVALPDETLKEIATYIWEAQFPPPCEHWQYGATRAQGAGDMARAAKERRMLERFCGK